MQRHNSREKTLLKSLKLFVAGSGSSQFAAGKTLVWFSSYSVVLHISHVLISFHRPVPHQFSRTQLFRVMEIDFVWHFVVSMALDCPEVGKSIKIAFW